MTKKALVFILVLLLSVSAVACIMRFAAVQADTNVSGVIAADVTWTEANSPYVLTGNILVGNGVTLTIEPGVTIDQHPSVESYYIMVNGTLQAVGSTTNPITFKGGQILFTEYCTDWNESTGLGCIIQNAVLHSSIDVEGGVLNISNNTITLAIRVDGGNPHISNNTFLGQGIDLGYHSRNSTISNNIISGCSSGIVARLDHNSSSIIQGNLIINNEKGLLLGYWFTDSGHPIVQNNTITNNEIGISLGSLGDQFSPIIRFNNIFDNTNYNMIVDNEYPLNTNATYNWWGTTDQQTINQTIYDFKNDFNLGTVTFVPFLTEANPAAPVSTFTITASAGTGGSINPSGSVPVEYGDTQTFTVTPDSGYQVASVLMDGVPATAPYTFVNVVADGHTITATFEPTSTPTPTTTLTPTPQPTPTPSTTSTPSPEPTPTPEIPEFPLGIILPSFMIGILVSAVIYRKNATIKRKLIKR
ncbi:hypothetical protein JW988_05575 [Candidatus Bathyarchaeota archaeon]|nr:hypothetical protein [Candidatus Bathyarchaeota archaeon]